MARRKYRPRRKSKPIFASKKSGNSVLGIIIMVVLLAALVFVGYSVGKPIMDYFSGIERPDKEVIQDTPESEPPVSEAPKITQETVGTTEPVALPEDLPTAYAPSSDNILFVFYPGSDGENYDVYIRTQIEKAKSEGYAGVCIELIADGGVVAYNSSSQTAVFADAVAANGIQSLWEVADAIKSEGLKPYARISALSDHIVSWYDKSTAYIIEGSISRWLDNTVANGGKPWMTPYSDSSQSYISELVTEISNAGFEGLIAGEIEYPPLRQRDMDYIGSSVKSPDRYKALCKFSSVIKNSFGTAKEYYVEVDAKDIISGNAEVLKAPDTIGTDTVLVRYNSLEIGERISRPDGSEISLGGLSEIYRIKTVLRLADESLDGSGLTIIPVLIGTEPTEELLSELLSMGYDRAMIGDR